VVIGLAFVKLRPAFLTTEAVVTVGRNPPTFSARFTEAYLVQVASRVQTDQREGTIGFRDGEAPCSDHSDVTPGEGHDARSTFAANCGIGNARTKNVSGETLANFMVPFIQGAHETAVLSGEFTTFQSLWTGGTPEFLVQGAAYPLPLYRFRPELLQITTQGGQAFVSIRPHTGVEAESGESRIVLE